jgi:PAS domain S-box-containing protein
MDNNDFKPSGSQPLNLMAQPEAIQAALEGVLTIDEDQRIIMVNPAAQRMFLRTADALIGASLGELMPARFRTVHEAHVRHFIASDAVERSIDKVSNIVGLRANGEEFPLQVAICKVVLRSQGGVRHCCTALLYDRSEVQGLSSTIERLNRQMRSIFDRAPVAIWITDGDRIVFANRACSKLFAVDDPHELVGKSTHELLRSRSHTPLWDKIVEALAHDAAMTTLNGVVVPRHGGVREVELAVGTLPDHHRMLVQMVITDVTQRSQERRDLLLSRRTLRELSANIVDAREEERRRIARELHDELGQRLMALKLELSAQQGQAVGIDGSQRNQAMLDMLDDTVASVRRIAMGLRPPMLDDLGLEAAIEWLVSEFRQHNGIRVDLALKPLQAAVPPDVAIAIYRILQEALTNIARHASAHKVRIAFAQSGQGWRLTVEDDGVGFPQAGAPVPRGSFGLIGMRERVLTLGGTLTTKNVAGGGARLELRIPLRVAGTTQDLPHAGQSLLSRPPDPADSAPAPMQAPEDAARRASDDTSRLAHELLVHQAELESQNEELRRVQSALAAARDRYLDLYEYAPVGYLTLDDQGLVQESNLTAAVMLGREHGGLKGKPFARHLIAPDADRWHRFLQQMLAGAERQSIDLAFSTSPQGAAWHGKVDCLRAVSREGDLTIRVTLTDVSDRVQADMERRIAVLDADARESERRRLALTLHENLGQRLSALKMEVAMTLRGMPEKDAAQWPARVAPVMEALDDAVATVRRITTDLRPPMLDDLGLNAAIEWLAQDTARGRGLRFSLSLDPDLPALPEPTALALYRFVQEALSYLLGDAGSTEFRIDLRHTAGALQLVVRSLGEAASQRAGAFLDVAAADILQHRSRLLGGQLRFDAARDRSGWLALQLTLPAPTEAPARPTKGETP